MNAQDLEFEGTAKNSTLQECSDGWKPIAGIASAFQQTQVLGVAVNRGIFTEISRFGRTDAEALSHSLDLAVRPVSAVLTCLTSMGLTQKEGDLYVNSPAADEFLVKQRPYYLGGYISFVIDRLWDKWGRLDQELEKSGQFDPVNMYEEFDNDPVKKRTFFEGMHARGLLTGQVLVRALNFGDILTLRSAPLLDLGGGTGAVSLQIARSNPDLNVIVLDRPSTLEITEEKIAEAGLVNRVSAKAGDLFEGPLPENGATIISRVVCDCTEQESLSILERVNKALPPGGICVISELTLNDDRTGPASSAFAALNMLLETRGEGTTGEEYVDRLKFAGFTDIRRIPVDSLGVNELIIGQKAA